MRRVPVLRSRVQLLLVLVGQVWLDVEDHLFVAVAAAEKDIGDKA